MKLFMVVIKTFKVNINDACKSCNGLGGSGQTTCSTCKGRGRVVSEQRTMFGIFKLKQLIQIVEAMVIRLKKNVLLAREKVITI